MSGVDRGGRSVRAHRLVALAGAAVLPWTVFVGPTGLDLVFLWGLANPGTGHFVGIHDYLFVHTGGLPDRLLAWPASTLLYLAGIGAALAEDRWHGDRRLPAGLVGLAGLAHLAFAVGLVRRGSTSVVPLGPVLAVVLVWWFYPRTAPRPDRGER